MRFLETFKFYFFSHMTTPESRRVQTDRKASFLDNIGESEDLGVREREERESVEETERGRERRENDQD